MRHLKIEDETHYAYIRTQSAITRYMNKYEHVGIKVGWVCAESSKQLNGRALAQSLKHWDELKFDRWCEEICEDSTMQYLYSKAGLKQPGINKQISVSEGCPYTAYPKDQRYSVQTEDKKDIRTICPVQKKVAAHWRGVAEVCSSLMQAHFVHRSLLPEDCIKKTNAVATVYNMLNHWSNPPVLSRSVVCDLVSIPLPPISLSDCTAKHNRQLKMPDSESVSSWTKGVDRTKSRQCVLL